MLGLALGCAAYGADEISGLGDFTSSGFSWGLAALVMGYATSSARRAPITAATLLVSATVFYYLLILLVSRRWQGGVTASGASADGSGLRSVARAAAFWLLGSVCGGAVLGWLGHLIRRGAAHAGAVAAGVALGLLAGESAYQIGLGNDGAGSSGRPLVSLCLAVVTTALLFGFRRGRRIWWIFAAGGVVAIGISVLMWIPVEHIRTYGL